MQLGLKDKVVLVAGDSMPTFSLQAQSLMVLGGTKGIGIAIVEGL